MTRAALMLAFVAACAHAVRPAANATPAPPGSASPAPAQPVPDLDAIREATQGSYEPERYVSARAYRHYLAALLARGDDDLDAAAAELREALLYDPDSPHLHTVFADVLVHQGHVAEADDEVAVRSRSTRITRPRTCSPRGSPRRASGPPRRAHTCGRRSAPPPRTPMPHALSCSSRSRRAI